MDNLSNFAMSALASGIDLTQSTAVLTTNQGSRFPSTNFNVLIWDADYPDMTAAYYSNALAIYRVLSREGDTLTFKTSNGNREAQENTTPLSHNNINKLYHVAHGTTAKLFTDIEAAMQTALGLTSNVSGVGFTLTGGATPHTLSVVADATVSGLNTGDIFKASFAEINSGNDDAKFITPSGLALSNVIKGPGSSTTNKIPQWSNTTGKLLTDGLAVGTSANNLVQLDSFAKLPAIDGSQLTGVSSITLGTFSNINVVSGLYTITHNKSRSAPFTTLTTIFNNSNQQVIPDNILGATNSLTIDLTSYLTISGTLDGVWGYAYL